MSRLEHFKKDKETIMLRILNSQGLCKALYYSDRNFLDKPDITDLSQLMYSKLFPYKIVPGTNIEESTFITLSFRNFRLVKGSFKSGYIYFNIFTHVNLHRTDHGFLRCDYILSEIDTLFNSQRGIGIGKLEFHDMDELYVNNDYSGYWIAYKPYDWN